MSQVRVFNWEGVPVGEFTATVNRGWAVNAGGTAPVAITAETASKEWLLPGCIALIEDDDGKLPAWAGVIDLDWKCLPTPQLTIYDIPFLLKYRFPDAAVTLNGTLFSIFNYLVQQANQWTDSLVRATDVSIGDNTNVSQTVELRSIWDQIVEISKKYGGEVTFQPSVDPATNRLSVQMMVRQPVYQDPVGMLFDGERGNMVVTDATAGGVIANHVVGTSDESTAASRRRCGPLRDDVSIKKYGLRQATVVFSGISNQTALDTATAAYLAANANPRLKLTINVIDKEDIFYAIRIGNILRVHSSRVLLPGGIRGWEGLARITGMSFDETKKTFNLTMEGAL
ncbi:hypothetical protein hrd7_25450 [Leptolinea sp. HRD-7]|nr:hypothetical protein hrd7_25450 [Leptolinea sp. HRD-7]